MAKISSRTNLKVNDSIELLSYVINETPLLRENIDLPVQGESINGIGKIIMKNVAYKNAFLNTLNLIGLTVITRNHWENPWKKFTDKGQLSYGQQVREVICDIANIYDYNEMLKNEYDFIKTEVPNVLSYLHEINYQKFYKTTTSDEQMAMAFETGDLFRLIDIIINSLYEGYEYDSYLVNKYMLARRIIDGTVTTVKIDNFANKTDREIVADIKAESNDMTFRSPNFNPAGLRKATDFEDQFAIVSTKFDAKFTTNVLATSYFRSDAEMKANMELCDGFGKFDTERLEKIFAKRDENGAIIEGEYCDGYVPLTAEEMEKLNSIPAVIVGRDFFQDYYYGMDNASEGGANLKATEFYNPQTLKRNHFLHVWGVVSTSPFENAVVFVIDTPAVTNVEVNPQEVSVSAGVPVQLTAVVETTGFANKAVVWSIDQDPETDVNKQASIDLNGKLTIPAGHIASTPDKETTTIIVKATSVFDENVTGTATITVL